MQNKKTDSPINQKLRELSKTRKLSGKKSFQGDRVFKKNERQLVHNSFQRIHKNTNNATFVYSNFESPSISSSNLKKCLETKGLLLSPKVNTNHINFFLKSKNLDDRVKKQPHNFFTKNELVNSSVY